MSLSNFMFSDMTWVAWNQPQWEHFHHGNCPVLQIRALPLSHPREATGKHSPAQHCFSQSNLEKEMQREARSMMNLGNWKALDLATVRRGHENREVNEDQIRVRNQIKVFWIYPEGNREPLKGIEQGMGHSLHVRKILSGFRRQSKIVNRYSVLKILFEA